MATYKLPKNWNAFNVWFTSFHKAFNSNAKKYGFSANDIKMFNQFYKNWQNSFNSYNGYNAFNKAMGSFFTNEFAGYQNFVQGFIGQISGNKNFNGNWNAFFGTTTSVSTSKTTTKKSTAKKATAKKSTATKTTVKKATTKKVAAKKPTTVKPAVKSTTSTTATKTTRTSPRAKTTTKVSKPTVKKTVAKQTTKRTTTKAVAPKAVKSVNKTTTTRTSVRATKPTTKRTVAKKTVATTNNTPFVWFSSAKNGVNVYVGGSKNGNFSLPTGTKAAYVEFKNGNGCWTKLTQGSNFPFVHNFTGNGKYSYRACWINNNGKKGSWSKPISNQNSVKAAA